jgi:uncharacterized protein YllA (UPF0747 family)
MEMLKQNLTEMMTAITEMTTKLQAAIDGVDVEKKDSYDQGMKDGIAQVNAGKVYSEAELQAKITEVTASLQKQIDELNKEVADLKAAATHATDLAAHNAEFVAALQAFEASETKSITELIQKYSAPAVPAPTPAPTHTV